METIQAAELYRDAERREYAIGAFSVHTADMIQAVLEAAEEERSPVILQIGQRAIRHCGFAPLMEAVRWYGGGTRVPIVTHLDHGKGYEQAIEAIRAGCTSVMYDGSHRPFAENVAVTREVVRAARSVGVIVEAELGKIAGVEDDLSVEDKDAFYTDPEEALAFFEQTGIDALAAAIGSAHGLYKSEPKLDIPRLQTISRLLGIPIVLHGGSGIPDDQIRSAISAGIRKINVDTELRAAYTEGVRDALQEHGGGFDVYRFAKTGADRVKAIVKERMRLFGSSGKA